MAYTEVRAILVTGFYRSGTTWVGRMLAAAPGVGYIHEPFNPRHRLGIFSEPCPQSLAYVCSDNQAEYLTAVAEMLGFRYSALAEFRSLRLPRDIARMARDWSRFRWHALRGDRPLVKDPHALFSAEWLSSVFGMDVVVMIRHPAAFASSIKRLGWPGAMKDMLSQPLLMRDLAGPFKDELERAVTGVDVIDQAILEWRIVHSVIRHFQSQNPEWLFVRHEDVARDPVSGFQQLYSELGLEFTQKVRERIAIHGDPSNPTEVPDPYGIKRNSRSSVWTWRDRLTLDEVERIYEGTKDIWPYFYSDMDWATGEPQTE